MRKSAIAIVLLFFVSCETQGVEKEKNNVLENENTTKNTTLVEENVLDQKQKVVDEKTLDNGIVIQWIEHGDGEGVVDGEVYKLDYKVYLEDQQVIDGNHLLNKPYIPFLVGMNMQTKGWDIALNELKVGDFAEIFIPSELARGEKEVKGLFPANSNNILRVRILGKMEPTRVVDGNKVWVFEENPNNTVLFDENTKITFHAMVSTKSNPLYINTYRENKPFELKLEDHGLVPGLKKSLINAKKSDRMLVLVKSKDAYGAKGLIDLVQPNEDIFYNILVMDVVPF